MTNNTYEVVADRILDQMDKGIIPWHKPWATSGAPRNVTTMNEYRGINWVVLSSAGYSSSLWVTYKQCAEFGAHVKKGERGWPVVFWGMGEKETENSSEEKDKFFFLKHYTLFNLSQCQGFESVIKAELAGNNPREFAPIESCERLVQSYHGCPQIDHGGNRACYSPMFDKVTMPNKCSFESEESYYSVLFHELTHSTGHATRLDRPGITGGTNFGSVTYSKEELCAELGAAFCASITGIDNSKVTDNSVAYIQSWSKYIRDHKKEFVLAAQQAQKAADHIQGKSFDK